MNAFAIEIENIHKTYAKTHAVQGLSCKIKASECFGFLGPNGAGKTTLMKMLYGQAVHDASSDSHIQVLGFDPKVDSLKIKSLSGVVPQEDNLDEELNVYQNLYLYSKFYGIPKKEAKIRINELLDFMELKDKQKSKIKQLSGGMKRRLTIARALLNNPKLLILDEPTTGLDPQVRHLIWDKLRKLKKIGVTILLTTHYMDEAFQICDQVLIMDEGKKLLEGNPKLLLNTYIEKYVLEIHNQDLYMQMTDKLSQCDMRTDQSQERYLIYSNDLGCLTKIMETLPSEDFFFRQANLEDLFLKITGRSLNAEQ